MSPPTRRLAAAAAATALFGIPAEATGQVQLGVGAGVVATSNLLTDSIVEPFRLRPNPSPYLGVTIETQLDRRYRVGLGVQVSRSDLVRHEAGAKTAVTRLTIWHPFAMLRQDLGPADVEARLGVLAYNPRTEVGTIFRDGAPVEPVVGLGIRVERPVGGLAAGLELRYDVHRFSTATLRNAGFSGETTIHRIAVGVSLRRAYGRETP